LQTHRLQFHPAFVPGKVRSLAVRWGRVRDGRVMLRYRLDGCEDVILPKGRGTGQTDELWQSTCFELFLADGGGRYREFNFAPDGRWAAYAFGGYRNRVGDHDPVTMPEIAMDSGLSVLTVTVFLDEAELAGASHAALTAVVEERGGRMSYWALRHPGLKPDFHEPTCFVLPVP
jgi:hypothetical protein